MSALSATRSAKAPPNMNILGLNAFHGDSSAALLCDGRLTAAVEEERFKRIKHWAGFPALAAKWCLRGTDQAELGHIAISRDPKAHLGRKVFRMACRPADWGQLADRARNTMQVARLASAVAESGVSRPDQVQIHHVEHHRAHLASAFFSSPFEEAAVVSVLDGAWVWFRVVVAVNTWPFRPRGSEPLTKIKVPVAV